MFHLSYQLIFLLTINIFLITQSFQYKTINKFHNKLLTKQSTRLSPLFAIKGPVRYSTNDWLDCLSTLPTSRILDRTKFHIFCLSIWSGIIVYLYKLHSLPIALPGSIHSILGAALSLLLVFRTNSSYDRFWEGRKLWSSISLSLRDIARLAYLHINSSSHKRLAELLVAFVMSLKQHLQGERKDSELAPFLTSEIELKKVQSIKNRPLYLIKQLTIFIYDQIHTNSSDSIVTTLHYNHFEESLHSLSSSVASCERIVKQPVPLAYSRHTSRFLSLYMLTLPLALVSSTGWLTVPIVALMDWSFVSIMEIGHFIEEPFNKDTQIISLSQLITIIRSDVSELLDGVIESPEIERFDQKLLESAKGRSRLRDDSFFAYY